MPFISQVMRRTAAKMYFGSLLTEGLSGNQALSALRKTTSIDFPRGLGYDRNLFLADWAIFKGTQTFKHEITVLGRQNIIPDNIMPEKMMKHPYKYQWTVEFRGYNPATGKHESMYKTMTSDSAKSPQNIEDQAWEDYITSEGQLYGSVLEVEGIGVAEGYRHEGYWD